MSFHCQVQIFPRKSVISKLNEFLKTIFIIYIANETNFVTTAVLALSKRNQNFDFPMKSSCKSLEFRDSKTFLINSDWRLPREVNVLNLDQDLSEMEGENQMKKWFRLSYEMSMKYDEEERIRIISDDFHHSVYSFKLYLHF